MSVLVRFFFGCLFGLFLLGNPALGHHSHGNYSIDQEIQIEGVVTELLLRNPHVWIFAEVEDTNGSRAIWGIESGGIAGFKRKGWGELSVGDEISVNCTPTRDGDNGCFLIDLVVNKSTENQTESKEWIQHTDRDQFFMVNFPTEPRVLKQSYLSEYGGTFPSTIYESRTQDSLYSLTVVDYSDAQNIYAQLADTINVTGTQYFWIYDQMGSIAYAAQQFRLRTGEVTYDAWHHVDFIDGHQVFMTNADSSRTYAGIYRHADRLYILEATTPASAPPQGIFQQSLIVLDEAGNRVRYQLEPAELTRVRIETDY